MEQTIHEGTAQELAPYLVQNPDLRYPQIEIADESEKDETSLLYSLFDEGSPYAVWSPYGSFAAAEAMMQALALDMANYVECLSTRSGVGTISV